MKLLEGHISIDQIVNKPLPSYDDYEATLTPMMHDVRTNGDRALKEYTARFDGAELQSLLVTPQEIAAAKARVSTVYMQTIRNAKDNIEFFHRAQVREGYELRKDGIILGQKITPIDRVGVYAPGGTASYPSSVLMSVIPAKIAGVREVVLATPPAADGTIADEILAVADLLGIERIVKCGGAQAIFALAFGTQSVPKVDKIVGPGNIYVTLAKKMVYGTVGIDMLAGPSEIVVLADDTAAPAYVASDLLAQAEHDALASVMLITPSRALAASVLTEITAQIEHLERRAIAQQALDHNGKIIVTHDMTEAIQLCNTIAPEHLHIYTEDAFAVLDHITAAGSIFLGPYTPVPLGDYYCGTNHIIPIGGNAAFASPVSVDDFVKKSQYAYYTKEALHAAADDVIRFATSEGLHAHAQAIAIRLDDEKE